MAMSYNIGYLLKCPKVITSIFPGYGQDFLKENEDMYVVLIQNGLDPVHFKPLLQSAFIGRLTEIIHTLLLVQPSLVTILRSFLVASISNGSVGTVDWMLSNGLSCGRDIGWDIIFLCQSPTKNVANIEMIKLLISYGADLNIHHGMYGTCLAKVATKGDVDLFRYLMSNGADLSECENICMKNAADAGNVDMLEFLISLGCDIHFNTDEILISAVKSNSIEMLSFLYIIGCNFEAHSYECLKIAVTEDGDNDHTEVVKFLFNHGVTIPKYAPQQTKLLFLAIEGCSFYIAKLLIDKGISASCMESHEFLHENVAMYRKFEALYERNQEKLRHRAAKKIYFWWIPICYDLERESGKRMMINNLHEFEKICREQDILDAYNRVFFG